MLLRVASSYLLVAEADGQIEVERKGMELAQRRRDEAQAFYEAGETTRVDVLRAETAIKEAERRMVLARQIREDASGRLRADLLLEGDLEVAAPDRIAAPLPEAKELLAIADSSRPEILRAGEEAEIARLEVLKQRGALWPTVQANAGWVWQKTPFPTDEYAYGGLSIIVPIFQGGEVGARVAQARERERQANLALDEIRLSVREEVRTALWNVESTRTNLRLTEEQLAAAEAEYRQVAELYRNQEATSLDADSSENSLLEARRAFVTAQLRVTFSELRAWYAAGALKTAIRKEGTP